MMKRRGQATVELALGTLVLVTVLLYGIAFAEWGVAAQKVKGAVSFAISTAAGQRTHLFSNANVASGDTFTPFNPKRAGDVTDDRFHDFDPLTDSGGGSRSVQTMAQTLGFNARCRPNNDLTFRVQRAGASHRGAAGDPEVNAVFAYLDNRFERRGAVGCSASAELQLINIPKRFAEGGSGFFKASHFTRGTIPLCGVGLPVKGKCPGELIALTGDWALEGPLKGALNELNDDVPTESTPGVNRPYRNLVREIWERNGKDQGSANEQMFRDLTHVYGPSGGANDPWIDTDEFHMSYIGDRFGRNVVNIAPHDLRSDSKLWYQTSGANLSSSYLNWNRTTGRLPGIPPCYLGLHGCE